MSLIIYLFKCTAENHTKICKQILSKTKLSLNSKPNFYRRTIKTHYLVTSKVLSPNAESLYNKNKKSKSNQSKVLSATASLLLF